MNLNDTPLAAVAIAMLLGMPAAWAGIGDYPLRLLVENDGEHSQLVARNQCASPVTLHLGGDFSAAGDLSAGRTVIVEPGSETVLGDVSDVAGHTLRYSFYVGRIDAEPDLRRCYRLPFPDGLAFPITQAHGPGMTSHDNDQNRYAVDFSMPEGTPVLASRTGVVADATLRYRASGNDPALVRKANRVSIVHDDGTVAKYAHLAPGPALVARGQRVEAGTPIGYSGNTGYSGGPHLHFVVSRPALVGGKVKPRSIPFCFYTGTPRVAFTPAVGMKPLAVYREAVPAAPPAAHAAQASHLAR